MPRATLPADLERTRAKPSFPRPYGKYELLERIGDGGMAEVFRARLAGAGGFEKIVVVKRILPHLASRPQVVQMFVTEARLAAQVQHKNVVQVFELSELPESGEYFMVMEYIRGRDLRQLIRSAVKRKLRIPPWFSVHLMSEVLDGLAHVHELTDAGGNPRNILHRDVTPSNIFVSYLGEIKLGDFGIAKENEQTSLTRTGQLKGKVAYMSPEQLLGEMTDQRADVFAAGIVLWECLAQRRLFGGRPDIGAMKLICDGERVPPSHFIPDIPEALDRCVLRALEIERDSRTASARDFQSELLDALHQMRRSPRPAEVRETIETLNGKRKPEAKEFQIQAAWTEIGLGFVDTGSDADATDPSAKEAERQRALPAKPHSTEMEFSFEESLVVRSERVMPVAAALPPFSAPDTPSKRPKRRRDDTQDSVSGPSTGSDAQDWLMQAQDLRREASSRISEIAAQRWAAYGVSGEPYRGPHPFWIRDVAGTELGPLSHEQVVLVIKSESQHRVGANAMITTDRVNWIDIAAYVQLTGQEGLLHDETFKIPQKGSPAGFLDQKSVASVFRSLTRDRLTGRLMMSPEGSRRPLYREIHLIRGAPTYVLANEDAMQFPEVLVQKELIDREQIPELIYRAVKVQAPLDELVTEPGRARPKSTLGNKLRVILMKERLLDVLRWTSGRFVFENGFENVHKTSFSRSLLILLPELVHRALSPEALRSALLGVLDTKLEPSTWFENGVADLGFSDTQREIAHKIAKGKKLSSLMKMHPEEQKVQMLVAYILLETELLIRP